MIHHPPRGGVWDIFGILIDVIHLLFQDSAFFRCVFRVLLFFPLACGVCIGCLRSILVCYPDVACMAVRNGSSRCCGRVATFFRWPFWVCLKNVLPSVDFGGAQVWAPRAWKESMLVQPCTFSFHLVISPCLVLSGFSRVRDCLDDMHWGSDGIWCH